MIQTLPRTIGLDTPTMVLLDQMRKQRNVIDYSGDLVSATMAAEAIKQAGLLLEMIRHWSFTRILHCPLRSPRKASRRLPGGARRKSKVAAASSCVNFRSATA